MTILGGPSNDDAGTQFVAVAANQTVRPIRALRGVVQNPKGSDSSAGRRHVPERPPVFSHSESSPIVIERSTDLHMS